MKIRMIAPPPITAERQVQLTTDELNKAKNELNRLWYASYESFYKETGRKVTFRELFPTLTDMIYGKETNG